MPEKKKSPGNPNWTVTKYESTNYIIGQIQFLYPDDRELWRVNGPKGVAVIGLPHGLTEKNAIARYKELYVND